MPSISPNSPDLDYFKSVPWCAKRLAQPGIVSLIPKSRRAHEQTTEHEFLSTTINSDRTLPFVLAFYTLPSGSGTRIDELFAFFALNSGLNGFPGVCHGGLVAAFLDEVMGMLIVANAEREAIPSANYMTGHLSVSYIKPVLTPSIILITARLVKSSGRKWYIAATIEDENGHIVATGESTYVAVRPKL